jgi:AcrR family transcriptional regulator
VEQIAEAAEVSPSTFFRYFPTKEDVVLYDDLDPILFAAFEVQPAELNPIQALRRALREVFGGAASAEVDQQWERGRLVFAVPELRMRVLDQLVDTLQESAELIARRVGRPPDDFAVRVYAGAIVGALLSAMIVGLKDPQADLIELMDASLAYLEAGMPL